MKKVVSFILLMLFSLSLISCGNVKIENEVKIVTPYGTPFLALGGLLNEENVIIDAVNGADGVKAELVKGEYDIVVAPINLAVQLYNKGNSKYVIEAVITMNNAYIVTNAENKLDSITDLKNNSVVAFGESGIPGNVFKTVLKNNNLELEVEYLASSTQVYSQYAGKTLDAKYVLMSEPEISKLVVNDKLDIKTLDLAKELGIDVPQACILVNPNSNKIDDINNLLKLVQSNVNNLNKNPEKYADEIIPLDRTFEAMGKEVIVRSIPLTNIVYKEAKEFKTEIENILSILGVPNPNDEFYR